MKSCYSLFNSFSFLLIPFLEVKLLQPLLGHFTGQVELPFLLFILFPFNRLADSTSTLGSLTQSSEATDCYNAIIKYIAHLVRRGKRKLWRWYLNRRKNRKNKNKKEKKKKILSRKRHDKTTTEPAPATAADDDDDEKVNSTSSKVLPAGGSFDEKSKLTKREHFDHKQGTVDLTTHVTTSTNNSSPQKGHPFALKLQQPPTSHCRNVSIGENVSVTSSGEGKGKPVRLAIFLYPATENSNSSSNNLARKKSPKQHHQQQQQNVFQCAPVASPEKSEIDDCNSFFEERKSNLKPCLTLDSSNFGQGIINGSCLKAASTTPTPRSPKQLNFAIGLGDDKNSASSVSHRDQHLHQHSGDGIGVGLCGVSSSLTTSSQRHCSAPNVMMVAKMTKSPFSCLLSPPEQQSHHPSSHHQTHANATRSVSNPCPSSDQLQLRSIHRKSSSHRTDSCSDTSLGFDWTYDSYEEEEEFKSRERRGSNRRKPFRGVEEGEGDTYVKKEEEKEEKKKEEKGKREHRQHQISCQLVHSCSSSSSRKVEQELAIEGPRGAEVLVPGVNSCVECHRNACACKGKRKEERKKEKGKEKVQEKDNDKEVQEGEDAVIATSVDAEDAVHFGSKNGPSACYSTGKKGNKHRCHSRTWKKDTGCHYSSNESISCSLSTEDEDDDDDDDEEEEEEDESDSSSIEEWHSSEGCIKCYNGWVKVTSSLKLLVDHKYFKRFIFLSILINALAMGIEYHNQPEELTVAVEISNMVFTFVFAFEMVLKLLADGCYKYLTDGFNLFDAIVVFVSLMELMADEEGSGLSVLRTFRLLRILKLVRFMPALKRQLIIMIRTMDNVAVFFALLVLFIFIFR